MSEPGDALARELPGFALGAAPEPRIDPVASLLVFADGSLCVDLPDHKGEVWSYLVEPAPLGLDAWAALVTRSDAAAGYRVAVSRAGEWRCACADMIYSRRRHRSRERGAPCKHICSVQPLYAALRRLIPEVA